MPDVLSQPKLSDVQAAADRLAGHTVRTPLLESDLLDQKLGGRLLLKAECLQRSGSFKFRGAFNFIQTLNPSERAKGVVAYSSGNHAQGVALAARLLQTPATIVMPSDAPAIKIENTRAYGANVVLYDRWTESREEIGARLSAETGASLIPPYEHPWIIAGQGTVALELAEQAEALNAKPDAVLVPCSGGGLTAGCGLVLSEQLPDAALYTVEPAGYNDTQRSLESGERVTNPSPAPDSICDALLLPTPGELTFAINRQHVTSGLVVSDDEARAAMRTAFHYFKLVLEPGGAVALAAVLSGKLPVEGRTLVVIASGGNVDPVVFQQALARP